jgi:CRISPR-associated exonuclease Cas4
MQITGTHFNYFMVCHRKLWFFTNQIQMEQESDLVYEGKLIHETSYAERSKKYEEIAIDGIKIDYYDARNKVVHEIKKSNSIEVAHVWQLKYYLYVLQQSGVEGPSGILEYPKLRKREEVWLSTIDVAMIQNILQEIEAIMQSEMIPPLQKKQICKRCAYFDLCYAGETDQTD